MFERTVIFLVSRPILDTSDSVPAKLRVFLKRSGAVPKNTILLHITQRHVPFVHEHYDITHMGSGVVSVRATFGFMEDPDASKVIRELYERGVFPKDALRCTIETSVDELIVDHDVPFLTRLKGHFFRFLLSLSVPRYRYFGLTGEASTGLSKIVIPIRMSRQGVRVEIPEFSLTQDTSNIDPDTHKPITVPFMPLS
jgi:K+ transporter